MTGDDEDRSEARSEWLLDSAHSRIVKSACGTKEVLHVTGFEAAAGKKQWTSAS